MTGVQTCALPIFVNPAQLTASAQGSAQVSCSNAEDGQITVTANGGTGDYTYSLNGGPAQSSNVFSGLAAGNYVVTVIDANNCRVNTQTVTISNPGKILAELQSTPQVSCNGASDGKIVVLAQGGTGSLTYSLNGGPAQSSNIFDGLTAGNYVITVYDANQCSITLEAVTIAEPQVLQASAQGTSQVSCFNAEDGKITVLASGGTGAYTYSLNGGPVQSSNFFNDLAAGSYTITVYDANNCMVSTNAVNILNPAQLTASAQGSAQVSCYNAEDGQITVTANGGTGDYTYSLNGGPAQSSNVFSGLVAGTYNVMVYDANGCYTGTSAIMINNPERLFVSVQASEQVSCHDAEDAQIVITATGGTGIYTYTLNGSQPQGSNIYSNLSSGTYYVQVYDANGCQAGTESVLIANPEPLSISLQASPQVSCHNAQDGQIIVNADGGTGVYSYVLNGGPDQSSNVFSNLSSGNYSIMVYDANQCAVSSQELMIANPDAISVNAMITSELRCNNGDDGQIDVIATGGTGTLLYSLNGGPLQSSASFYNLASGYYVINVVDENNCSAQTALAIENPEKLVVSYDVVCSEGRPGIVIHVEGGIGPYSYSIDGGQTWQNSNVFSELAAGTTIYVVVGDSRFCSVGPIELPVNDLNTLNASVSIISGNSCYGANDAVIQINSTGGVQPYSFALDQVNYSGNNIFENIGAGSHVAFVQDANACPVNVQFEIEAAEELKAQVVSISPADCGGKEEGAVEISVSGGSAPYNFFWSNGESGPAISGLDAGVYVLSVTDDNNCELKYPIEIIPGENTEALDLNNVFSPNGDGINDTWVIGNLTLYPENELVVLNRWGNEVYTQKTYNNDWDGSQLLDGTYFYILKVTMCGERQTYNGYVTIVR